MSARPEPPDGPNIVTALWFDGDAEAAVDFYLSLFEDSRIVDTMYWGEIGPGAASTVLSLTYELAGQRFVAINGGPGFSFTPAMSLFVPCDAQAEIDRLWDALLAGGGAPMRCGWLTDRFGVSWQIVPASLGAMLRDPDVTRRDRVMAEMMTMVKLDIDMLQQSYGAR